MPKTHLFHLAAFAPAAVLAMAAAQKASNVDAAALALSRELPGLGPAHLIVVLQAMIAVEAVLAVLLLNKKTRQIAALGTLVLSGAFLCSHLNALLFATADGTGCACFGAVDLPMGVQWVILLLLSGSAWICAGRRAVSS